MKTDFLARIGDRLSLDEAIIASAEAQSSDFDLNPQFTRPVRDDDLRQAAVLVPIIDRPNGLTVLLTRRAAHLPTHAGQISFPGGRLEDSDDGFVDAALRETEEEVGLDRAFVEVLGLLDPYETVTGFFVVPVLGLVREGFSLTLDPGEVEAAFEVPLDFLMEPTNHQTHDAEYRGGRRSYYAIAYGDHYIWGATAAMLIHMHRRLFEA